ncbi:MAG: hypothetical protein WC906_05240 [Parcubacteria group bacterium]
MKKEEQGDNLNEAEEAKIALGELADITLDKYIEEEKVKSKKLKKCKETEKEN